MTEYKSKVKYEAPIEINIEEDFPDYGSMAVSEIENMICSAVLKVGITVDKEELIKALRYDRGQYEKGYADGKRDAAAAIEALQAELEKKRTADCWGCKCEKLEPKRGQYVHGRELSREYIGDCLVSIDYEDWRCSVCGIVFEQWSIPKYNYCPNCGADMRKMEVQE